MQCGYDKKRFEMNTSKLILVIQHYSNYFRQLIRKENGEHNHEDQRQEHVRCKGFKHDRSRKM